MSCNFALFTVNGVKPKIKERITIIPHIGITININLPKLHDIVPTKIYSFRKIKVFK